ncbi:hypothetical protein BZA05DRAFT_472083 [Tricharina praecox]|uniref:uncharacterized protein n=1 Tax=Tricharina praecox TaxID=43433 RepID=UPI00221EE47B|nr:uncharacterized protein BZA05DRAFT_472083 [Tricharina praecox]KAI5855170.1 hypothetical protein BZA05DRAFT_472083 [Tricharina praecox]
MAPRAHPLPAPIPLAHALADAHKNGWNDDTDDTDSDDDDRRWRRPSSTSTPTGTSAADLANGNGVPTGASLVSSGNNNENSIHPVAIILPVLAGVALLLLAIGGFMIWRRRRRAAAAAAAAADGSMGTETEMSVAASAAESTANLRGGAGAGGTAAYGEKYYPGPPGAEIPPRYEDSQRDRSVSVSTVSRHEDPFADPYERGLDHSHGHGNRDEDDTPVSPVSETAAERGVVADGYRHEGR